MTPAMHAGIVKSQFTFKDVINWSDGSIYSQKLYYNI